jgi:hypothetical protein
LATFIVKEVEKHKECLLKKFPPLNVMYASFGKIQIMKAMSCHQFARQ